MLKLLRPKITKSITALFCAALWFGPAHAAEPAKKRDMFYYGEKKFCLRLLNNADKAEKIEPAIGPTRVMDIDEGELYAPKIRLYIVQSPMPLPVIYKLIKQRQWMTLLGYTPWKANSSAGRMITDPRWRKYDDQCPGIFRFHHYRDPDKIVGTPTEMTLFEFDADGDGRSDKIYRYMFDATVTVYANADFKACTRNPIISLRAFSNLFQFEGKSYVITDGNPYQTRRRPRSNTVYRINRFGREIDRNVHTCRFSGIDRFTDYLRDKHLINKPIYGR